MEKFQEESVSFQEEESSFDVKKILFKYLSYWKWFVVSIIFFVAVGCVYLMTLTPQYKVTASILVKDEKKMGSSSEAMLEQLNIFSSSKLVENEIEILKSYTLMEKVVEVLDLEVTYTYKKGLRQKELYKDSPIKIVKVSPLINEIPLEIYLLENDQMSVNGINYSYNDIVVVLGGSMQILVNDSLSSLWNKKTPIYVSFSSKEAKAESLRGNISIGTSGKGSSVLQLSLLSSVPAKGRDILNSLIDNYNLAAIADKNTLADKTMEFIDRKSVV